MFFSFVSLALVAACSGPETPTPGPQGYVAIITNNIEASESWYKSVFSLERKNWLQDDSYKIALLKGDEAVVEIIEFNPPSPEYVSQTQGIFKAGFIISDFDGQLAKWRAGNVTFALGGEVFYNEALNLHSIILLDPDENLIQVFGVSNKG